ncbi:MAG: arylamine N-acetyltransferase [Anaerolineae bacterium]|nr:arylamine N-acetyltransferase [Anaerolineae bacterium]
MKISSGLAHRILHRFALDKAPPTLPYLTAILNAYVQTVPWESASRIVRRAQVSETEQCPRWPEEFWEGALQRGLGGTCFESNYAFLALLHALGFEGYLTINDMHDYVGCHTATVVQLDREQWMADAGFPVLAPLQLDAAHPTHAISRWLHYTALPQPNHAFVLERTPHPAPYMFTVYNTPIADADYRAATTHDYGPNGLFLQEVNINKVVDGALWRFSTRELPLHLETFVGEQRIDIPIKGDLDQAAHVIAAKFGMDEPTLREALAKTLKVAH